MDFIIIIIIVSSLLFILVLEDLETPISCKHSLVFLKMDEIISRNMLNWLRLLIKLLLLYVEYGGQILFPTKTYGK